jgi:hypothetical protein
MSDLEQIEQEILTYLDIEKNLRKEDRLKYLMNIVKKHDDVNKMEHIADYYDVMNMISYAKGEFASARIPMKISKKEVQSQEAVYVLMLESFVCYLNKNKILRRLVRFDHDSQRR